jgi:hypothetical protein
MIAILRKVVLRLTITIHLKLQKDSREIDWAKRYDFNIWALRNTFRKRQAEYFSILMDLIDVKLEKVCQISDHMVNIIKGITVEASAHESWL